LGLGAADLAAMFNKESAISSPAQTPTFIDGIWTDTMPHTQSLPPTDLTQGDWTSPLGRICVTRHPLMTGAKATIGQPLPGGIQMGYADGHAQYLKLNDIKVPLWGKGYSHTGDIWSAN